MLKRKLSSIIVVALMTNLAATPLTAFAETINNKEITQESQEATVSEAKISRFDTYYSNYREAYDAQFRMSNSNIENVYTNGGYLNYYSKVPNMTDDKLDTYWETKQKTTDSFKNEVIFTLKEETVLNRIAYRSAWNTVGFAEDFEIWASDTVDGNDFRLVTTGKAVKTADMLEIKFNQTNFKRVKFVFKNNGTATISEMMFYKEDKAADSMSRLFTDNTYANVSDEFNNEESLNKLEELISGHPLYESYKTSIDDARAILNKKEIEATTAGMRKVNYTESEEYNNIYKISRDKIQSIKAAGGQYLSQAPQNAIDGSMSTYWETGRGNDSNFKNEVEIMFKEPVKINRVVYAPRQSDLKGFANEIEIYASTTSKGDTYQLVATGSYNKVWGLVEAKFKETEFKRLKFKFKNSDQNWASLS